MINKSKKIVLSLATVAAIGTSANAGVILDFEAGIGMWDAAPSGSMSYTGSNIDLENTLGLENSSNMYMYADFNHFIPIIPNLRVEKQDLIMDSTKAITGLVFDSKTYAKDTKTNLDLSQQDLILYWGIPGLNILTAGIVDINFGLDLKQFKGGITLSDDTDERTADIDFVVPMGYVAATIDHPFIPATLSASYKTISYKDSSLKDIMAKVSVNLPIPLPFVDIKAEVGYKKQTLDLDKDLTDSLSANLEFSGLILGISAKF